MDFAFSTILLFLIIAPGLVARYCYFTHPFANDARSSELISEVFWSIIPGILIQLSFAKFLPSLFGYNIKLTDIGFLLIGKDDNQRLDLIMQNIQNNILPIIVYNLFILCTAASIGILSKEFVRLTKLDKRSEFFRFSNKWFYIMSGEILDTDNSKDSSGDIDLTLVDVLCKVGNENILYMGELVNYYLTKNGDLDSILLRYPMRRKLSEDNQEDPYYQIPSNFLYIPDRDILNINLRYLQLGGD